MRLQIPELLLFPELYVDHYLSVSFELFGACIRVLFIYLF